MREVRDKIEEYKKLMGKDVVAEIERESVGLLNRAWT